MTARMRDGSTTDDYRNALSGEGEFMSLGYEWSDKPHRLVYDLCGEVDALRAQLTELADAVAAEVDAKPGFGGSGFLLARLEDSRNLLKQSR